MSSPRKAGSDFGVDRGVVTIFLLWIAITVVLGVMLAVEAHCQTLRLPHAVEIHGSTILAVLTIG
jgi:hypothetical protein